MLRCGTQEQLDAKPKEIDINRVCGHKKEASSWCIASRPICLVFPALRRSRSSASPSPMVCRRLIMSMESALTARRHYALRVLRMQIIFRSSLPSYSKRAVHGGASPMPLSSCESTPSFGGVFVVATVRLICLRSAADQLLFSNILTNSGHLLHRFLPPPTAASQNYNLRIRPCNRQLTLHSGHLIESNIFIRMLYANIY